MPRPADIPAFRRHAEWALAATTALELGIVDALADGPATAEGLAGRLSLSRRGTRLLLGALEALGAARLDPEGWRLTGAARALLVDPDTPDHAAPSLRHWLHGIRRWTVELPEAVRTGAPVGEPGPGQLAKRDPVALERFLAAMDDKDPALVGRVADACLARVPGARRALDVGGGPGTFAHAFAARGVRVTLLDRPEVIEFVGPRYRLEGHPAIELRAADFLAELPEGSFDVVLLANITHIYPPAANAALLRRLAGRLAEGGVLGVLDFVRGLSEFAPLFALTMLLNTEAGETYDLEEYAGWLQAAGLARVRAERMDDDAHLITALRPSGNPPERGPDAGG